MNNMKNIKIEELQVFLYFIHKQNLFCNVSTDKMIDYIKFRLFDVPVKDVYNGILLENNDILSFILDHIMCNHEKRFGDFNSCYCCNAFRPLVDKVFKCAKTIDKRK